MSPRKRKARHNIIAIVFDFDGTLSPNNMQEDTIFREYRISKDALWRKADRLVKNKGYERTLAYLKLLIHDPVFKKKPLKKLFLKKMASKIAYFPGVEDFFSRMRDFVNSQEESRRWNIILEFYVISSGMKEILEGTALSHEFKRIYACEYEYGPAGPVFPKIVINDTNKIQFLFRINKGKLDLSEDINSHMPDEQRRIPFSNMIYIGDSVTDIPSMVVTKRYGGCSIGVFNPSSRVSPKFKALVRERRVDQFAPADYRAGQLLERIVKTSLKRIVTSIAYTASSELSRNWVRRHPG